MTAKIFRSIFISVLAVFLLTLGVTLGFSYGSYTDAARRELVREAEIMRDGIENYGDGYLRVATVSGVRVTRVLPDGRVVFDTRVEDSALPEVENHLEREEIAAALRDGEGFAVRYSDTVSERTLYYAVRLDDGSVLRVGSVHDTAIAVLLRWATPLLLLIVAVSLITFVVAKKLSVSIVRPINELDLEKPTQDAVYEELRPVVDKLAYQHRRITRQMSELRLRETEFNSITENMSEGMIVINSRTYILSCNRSARLILGLDGEPPRSALSLNYSGSFRSAISSALYGKTDHAELVLAEKHYSVVVTPVLHDGIVEGAVIMLFDVTETERREALRREFTSNISHELKTPLTSISGFAELIRCGMADGEEAKHFAGNIMREADRLITLVGDIIRLTQLDGGEIPYDEDVIDLHELACEVVDRLANVAEAAGVTLSVSGSSVGVRGTRQIIEEMVYNLCDNGIKYNKEGGSVTVNVSDGGGFATVAVSDTGIGIPAEMQDRVFERFYRVDKSHSKAIGGTGLGLSIVKHAAAYHKAHISLESTEGVETTVRVDFPTAEKI